MGMGYVSPAAVRAAQGKRHPKPDLGGCDTAMQYALQVMNQSGVDNLAK